MLPFLPRVSVSVCPLPEDDRVVVLSCDWETFDHKKWHVGIRTPNTPPDVFRVALEATIEKAMDGVARSILAPETIA